jgi:hypothetical protein
LPSWRAFAIACAFALAGLGGCADGMLGSRVAPALEFAIAGFLWLAASMIAIGRSRNPTFRDVRGAVEAKEQRSTFAADAWFDTPRAAS